MGKDSKKLIKELQAKFFNWFCKKDDNELRAMNKASSPERMLRMLIPESLAINPSQDEPKKLILNFLYFNFDCCNFQESDPAKMKSLLLKLKLITSNTRNSIIGSGLIHGKVSRDGDYKELFNNLEGDVEKLDEIEISYSGRIYGFIAEDYFYLVAVDAVHRNTH